jgi:predicted Mrr-cat superfamily restriction endonuclease
MVLTPQQTEKLLKGNFMFSLWSLSMLVTRLKGVYSSNPSSPVLENCAGELNAFVNKFSKIMGNDYTIIQKL